MELNPEQNKLISDFFVNFGHPDSSGRLHEKLHITDIRKLVEECINLERNSKGGEKNGN